jgi:hypothetical protein
MAITDEASLLRERLREQQDLIAVLKTFVLEYYQTGDSPIGKEWAKNYLDGQKPENKTVQE